MTTGRRRSLHPDRLLVTTDTTSLPTNFGPSETGRQSGSGPLLTTLNRTIVYTYDRLYRLTEADYTSGELYEYEYDPVGNRLQQIIDGDTITYTYDAANRLDLVAGQSYTFDDNGNLLQDGTFSYTNRLTQVEADTFTTATASASPRLWTVCGPTSCRTSPPRCPRC